MMAAIRSPLATFSIVCVLTFWTPPARYYSVRAQQLPDADWTAYGRDAGGERFSPLDDIRRENVTSLEVAWTFRAGDAYQPKNGRPTALEATPLHIDGTLYLSTPVGRVFALDPVTGQQRWVYDAKVPRDMGYGDFASRGISAWQRGTDRRIIVATIDARLIALDARSGTPVARFGRDGRQYVVISAGGHGVREGLPIGDYVVAFALPRRGRLGTRRVLVALEAHHRAQIVLAAR
jgi:glucose dehydrogenase